MIWKKWKGLFGQHSTSGTVLSNAHEILVIHLNKIILHRSLRRRKKSLIPTAQSVALCHHRDHPTQPAPIPMALSDTEVATPSHRWLGCLQLPPPHHLHPLCQGLLRLLDTEQKSHCSLCPKEPSGVRTTILSPVRWQLWSCHTHECHVLGTYTQFLKCNCNHEICWSLETLCNSVNQYFPNDQWMIFKKIHSEYKTDQWILMY